VENFLKDERKEALGMRAEERGTRRAEARKEKAKVFIIMTTIVWSGRKRAIWLTRSLLRNFWTPVYRYRTVDKAKCFQRSAFPSARFITLKLQFLQHAVHPIFPVSRQWSHSSMFIISLAEPFF
jgi:hypothetical protein